MNIYDLNTLRMAEAVLAVLLAFVNKLGLAPILPELKDELEAEIALCRSQNQRLVLLSGNTELKQTKRDLLEKAVDMLVNTLLLYGNNEKKPDVVAKADLYYADIHKVGGDKLVDTCRELIKLTTSLLHELVKYQMTTEKLDAVSLKLNEYAKLISAPRGEISTRSAIRSQVEIIVSRIRSLLNDRMDKSMNIIRDDEPEFFQTYTNARYIVDLHGKRRLGKPEDETKGIVSGRLTDSATGDPLMNVMVRAEGVEEATMTDAHGVFMFEGLEPGKRNILCIKETFQNLSFTAVEVIAGEETELEGRMNRV